jgi:histidinol-phosphate/aromatic aminotransferase/cobyric acid decarboxylase-like protein
MAALLTLAVVEFRRIHELPPYVFATVDALKRELRQDGRDVIDLGFGNPDIPSPAIAVEKLCEAATRPINHRYSASRGLPNLRAAVCERYERVFGVTLDPNQHVVSTIGAKEGLSHLMWVLLDAGDSAVVPSPSYPIHLVAPRLAGATVVHARFHEDDLLAGIEEAVRAAQPAPRVVIVSFPHNPTTAIATPELMQSLVDLAREREFVLVNDFAYADIAFDGHEPPSVLAADGALDCAVELYSLTKSFSMAGWRMGFTIGRPDVVAALAKLKSTGDFKYPFDLGTGDSGTEWWTYGYSPFLQSFGGDMIDRDGFKTADGVLNGDAAKKWAAWFRGLVDKGYVPAKSSVDAFADFSNGKTAMVWTGIWNATGLDKVKDGVPLPPPDFGNGPKIGGGSWQWGVSATCKQADAAMDYLAFSLNPKYLSKIVEVSGNVPATEEAAEMTPGWQKGGPKRFFLDESAAFAELRPATPGYPYLTSTFAKAAQDIINGGDANKILDKAVADIDTDLKANDYYGN